MYIYFVVSALYKEDKYCIHPKRISQTLVPNTTHIFLKGPIIKYYRGCLFSPNFLEMQKGRIYYLDLCKHLGLSQKLAGDLQYICSKLHLAYVKTPYSGIITYRTIYTYCTVLYVLHLEKVFSQPLSK